eukprot:Nk52_evm38s2340 gene=Nk52_evmTU38s2340
MSVTELYNGFDVTYIKPKRVLKKTILGGIPLVCFAILIVEACERFGYYTNANVNSLYVTEMWGKGSDTWSTIGNMFTFWCYATALVGGYIADVYWGKKRTILMFALVYCCGMCLQFLAAFPFMWKNFPEDNGQGSSEYVTYTALFSIGLGAGAIKANVGPLMAEQLTDVTPELSTKAWGYFYWAINIGGLLSAIVGPLAHQYGEKKEVNGSMVGTSYYYSYAIGFACIIAGVTVFSSFWTFYTTSTYGGSAFAMFLKSIWSAIKNRKSDKKTEHWIERAEGYSPSILEDYRSVISLMPILCFFPFFFISYNNVMNLAPTQASFFQHPSWLTSDVISAFDSFMIIALIPLTDFVIYPALRKANMEPSMISKITFGFFLAGLGNLYLAGVQWYMNEKGTWSSDMKSWQLKDGESSPSFLITVGSMLLLGAGEVFASVTLNELCYTQAPVSMKSIVFSLGVFTTAIASIYGIVVSPLLLTSPRNYLINHAVIAGLTILAGLIFYFLFRKNKLRSVCADNRNKIEEDTEIPIIVDQSKASEEPKKAAN